MSRYHKTPGFAAIEIVLVVVVLIVLSAVGYVAFNHSQYRSQDAKTTAPPAGWLTYKSAHSPIQFSYPKTWRLKQVSLDGKPNYYLEEVSLTGPHNFGLDFTLQKTHTRPNQFWACPKPPLQKDFSINSQYKMVVTDQNSVSLLATDAKGSVPDDLACGSLINTIGPGKLFKFSGGYANPGIAPTQSIDIFVNESEVQTTKTIFSTLKQ